MRFFIKGTSGSMIVEKPVAPGGADRSEQGFSKKGAKCRKKK